MVVFADETRPFLQGARLTAWELLRDGIQTTVITDSMAGALMHQDKVNLVVVGADRIAKREKMRSDRVNRAAAAADGAASAAGCLGPADPRTAATAARKP